jgi:hypothetical protein
MIDEGRRSSSPTYFVTVALWYIISHMFSQLPNPTSGQRQRQSQRHRQSHKKWKTILCIRLISTGQRNLFLSKIKINFIELIFIEDKK